MKFFAVTLLIIISANLLAAVIAYYTGWEKDSVLSALYAGVVGLLYGEILRLRGER